MTDQDLTAPHCQAAFINAIREEGTHKEACDWLRACKRQDTWNAAIEAAAKVADVKPRKGGRSLSGPHHQGIRDGRAEAARLIRALKKGPRHDDN